MIKLLGSELHQWDLNRYVYLTDEDYGATEVHFANWIKDRTAFVVEPIFDSKYGKIAKIPNSLLTLGETLIAWSTKDDITISINYFVVKTRSRPSDYVYEPTDVVTMESLREWVINKLEEYKDSVVTNYEELKNKPSIEEVVLVGDVKLGELGVELATNEDIDELFSIGEKLNG